MYKLLIEREPVSVNNNSNHAEYENELLGLMKQRYPLLPGQKTHYARTDKLYVQMIYICKNRCQRDIDNILKYTIDSFRKYLYKDDHQIGYALSQSIECKDNNLTGINITQFDKDIAERIFEFLNSDNRDWKSCTYFECGLMTDKFYHCNLEDLWK